MKRMGRRKSNGSEFDPSTLYACMEISQWNPFIQLIYTDKNGKRMEINNCFCKIAEFWVFWQEHTMGRLWLWTGGILSHCLSVVSWATVYPWFICMYKVCVELTISNDVFLPIHGTCSSFVVKEKLLQSLPLHVNQVEP
jgi:hypothetical protein